MISNQNDALAKLGVMALPRVFEKIWARDVPLSIYDVCVPAKRYFEMLEQGKLRFARLASFVPFWEENLEAIVGFDEVSREYIRHHYDARIDDVILGTSYQRFLTAFFIELVDSGVWDQLQDLSKLFDYKHTDEFRAFCLTTSDETWDEDYLHFLASIQ